MKDGYEISFIKKIRKYADSGYQITIPSELVEIYGIKKGDIFQITIKFLGRRKINGSEEGSQHGIE